MKQRLFLAALAIGALILLRGEPAAQELNYQIFGRYLEPLAQQIGMPGLSAVIVHNNIPVWDKGYGFADVEAKRPADRDTPYPIGGVSQAVTGVLAGICVDRHLLAVDEPIRTYVPAFPNDARVRHLLAHASEGRFVYDPARFAQLTTVLDRCMGQPFRASLASEILTRLIMTRSVPGLDMRDNAAARALFDTTRLARYDDVLRDIAVPYRIRAGRYSRTEYAPSSVDAATGIIATAYDLAKFEGSLDDTEAIKDNIPIDSSTLATLWTRQTFDRQNFAGETESYTTPTGLGWFVQTASGVPLVWTYGYIPDTASALIVKMPTKHLTMILLSNSDGLAAGFNFERGDVTTSPFVKVFLRLFI